MVHSGGANSAGVDQIVAAAGDSGWAGSGVATIDRAGVAPASPCATGEEAMARLLPGSGWLAVVQRQTRSDRNQRDPGECGERDSARSRRRHCPVSRGRVET